MNSSPGIPCVGVANTIMVVRQTYADFFALGWVRVVREANRIVYENPAGLTEEHGAIPAQLAREQKLPLVR